MNCKSLWALPAVVAFGLSVAAQAAPVTAKPGDYTIDPNHTQIIFAIPHEGLSTFYGRFSKVSGSLSGFDPAAPEKGALTVTIDMTGIQTHVDELDSELKDVFHVTKFPTATFTGASIAKTGDNTGTVTGNLTLNGVTKPVTLNITFNGGRNAPIPFQPYRIGFDATATIHRADFGIDGMIWSGFVGDDVKLMIECEMEKK
jgi:polyisoprenoid-binding protein YceI